MIDRLFNIVGGIFEGVIITTIGIVAIIVIGAAFVRWVEWLW
jgi:hypothetical protein